MLQKEDERVRDLISLGKERGFVSFDEVNDILPTETRTSADIDSLFSAFEHHNVPVYEDAPVAKTPHGLLGDTDGIEFEGREDHAHGEDAEVNETAHLLDKTSDPVRLYLREMGSVPLLKREDEVAIAKRMERGRGVVLRTLSRSPLVVKELIKIGKEIRTGELSRRRPATRCASSRRLRSFTPWALSRGPSSLALRNRAIVLTCERVFDFHGRALRSRVWFARLDSTPSKRSG